MNCQGWIDDLIAIAEVLKIGDEAAFAAVYDEPFDDNEAYPCLVIDPNSIEDTSRDENRQYPTGAFRRVTEIYVLADIDAKTKEARKTAYQEVDDRLKIFLDALVEAYAQQDLRVELKTYPKFQIGERMIQAGMIRFSVIIFDET